MPGQQDRGTLSQIWRAIRQLNPGSIAEESKLPFSLAIVAANEAQAGEIRAFLAGPDESEAEAVGMDRFIERYHQPLGDPDIRDVRKADFVLAAQGSEAGLTRLKGVLIIYDPANPESVGSAILNTARGWELRLSLARHFPALRQAAARCIIRDISKENALFVIATALGHVVPNVFQPVMGVAEAAGDTAFLTANQVRMLFAIGAIHNEKIGYVAQWREVSSIVGAAFGWRALARNLISKIPFGGGLIPKGAVAYAGTTAVGEGVRFFYVTGRRMTRAEMKQAFKKSYSGAVEVVRGLVSRARPGGGENIDSEAESDSTTPSSG